MHIPAILRGRSGLTLVEIILASALIAAVGIGLATFAPQAIRAIVRLHSRSVATSLASTKIEDTKARPYAVLPVTPNGVYFSTTSVIGACDCTSADFTRNAISSETITVGETVYTRQTCMNYVQKTSLGTWQSNCLVDTAMKQIVTNVSWTIGSDRQSFTMQSLASPPAQYAALTYSTGTVSVSVCPADGNVPPNCDPGGNLPLVAGADVSVYNNTFTGWSNSNPAIINVPAASNYTVHVQKAGFYPVYLTNQTVSVGGTTNIPTVVLRDVGRYGSKLVGEATVADHPVISRVVAQVADTNGGCNPPPNSPQCSDLTEAVELYNPTSQAYQFGPGGTAQLVYCNSTICNTADLVSNLGAVVFTNHTGNATPTLASHAYFLVEGVDTTGSHNVVHGPGSWEWNVQPDISYDVNLAPPEGLIPYKTGGGIQLRINIGGTWTTVDAVSWQGASPPIGDASIPAPGPWVGAPLPQNSMLPVICQ